MMMHERIAQPQVRDAAKTREAEEASEREVQRAEHARTQAELEARLMAIADAIVRGTLAPDIREGVVMTVGPVPYRRLDCDGRALAYVKTRPKKRAVRVDVSGLWTAPPGSRLRIHSSSGATLMVTAETDIGEAIAYLKQTVEVTRSRRRPQPRQPSVARTEPQHTAAMGE